MQASSLQSPKQASKQAGPLNQASKQANKGRHPSHPTTRTTQTTNPLHPRIVLLPLPARTLAARKLAEQ